MLPKLYVFQTIFNPFLIINLYSIFYQMFIRKHFKFSLKNIHENWRHNFTSLRYSISPNPAKDSRAPISQNNHAINKSCHHPNGQWAMIQSLRQTTNVTEPVNIAQSVCLCTACNLLQTCNLAAVAKFLRCDEIYKKRKRNTRTWTEIATDCCSFFPLLLAYLTLVAFAKSKQYTIYQNHRALGTLISSVGLAIGSEFCMVYMIRISMADIRPTTVYVWKVGIRQQFSTVTTKNFLKWFSNIVA